MSHSDGNQLKGKASIHVRRRAAGESQGQRCRNKALCSEQLGVSAERSYYQSDFKNDLGMAFHQFKP